MRKNNSKHIAAACCALALAPGSAVLAQGQVAQMQLTAQNVSPQNQSEGLEEIVVTAEKRSQSFLDVPITENVVTKSQLETFQVQDLMDMATQVPGLKLSTATNSVGTQVTLRGIGTNTLDAGIDQSVALYIDGMQITQGLAYGGALFDTGQVEVLKGPQALFYGKNSPGGVIAVRSADPTDQFEASASYGREFEAKENTVEAYVSGPIFGDVLEGRLAGKWDESDGWLNLRGVGDPALGGMTPPDSTGPRNDSYIFRGTLLFKPSEQFDARLKVTVSRDINWDSGEETNISCPGGNGVGPAGIPFLTGGPCSRSYNLYQVDLNPAAFPGLQYGGVPTQDITQHYGTLELSYRPISSLTISSDTGYYFGSFAGTLASPFDNGPAGSDIGLGNDYDHHELTEELRVNSDFKAPVNFTAGVDYQNAHVMDSTNLIFNQDLPSPSGPFDIYDEWYLHHMAIKTWSGFAQVRVDVTSQIQIDVGGRYTSEKRNDYVYETFGFGPAVAPYPGASTPGAGPYVLPNLKTDNFSPEGTITYRPTQDLSFYATAKKGFKSGSYNITNGPTNLDGSLAQPYGPEHVWGVETGVKSLWLDRTLAVDSAIYWYRYSGLQVGATENTGGGIPVVDTFNAASALIYGLDLDANWQTPVSGLQLKGALEYNRAKFESFYNAPCWGGQTFSEGCDTVYSATANGGAGGYTSQNLTGDPLQRAPLWQISGGPTYTFPVSDKLSVTVASDTQFSSRYLMLLGDRSDFWQGSFVKTDLSVALNGPDHHWQVAFIGKNLSNTITTGTCNSYNNINSSFGGQFQGNDALGHGPAGVDSLSCYIDRGRELWLRLTWKPF
jgi:iron complex outermembrane recepter protein